MTKTHATYIIELTERNPGIECLGTYAGATTKILHRCRTCKHEWLVRPASLVGRKPTGCPHCGAVKAGKSHQSYTTETYAAALSHVHPSIELKGEYPGSHKKALFKCSRCNHEWKAMPYSVLQGHGCPRCAKSGTSFMEQVFLGALTLAAGDEEVQHRNKDAIGEELDIYIPAKRTAIEPGSWTLHKRRLWKDKQKLALCAEAGIRLIFVYDMFPSETELPFDSDCIVFEGDFNREDHEHLWFVVQKLLSLLDLTYDFDLEERRSIETEAYVRAKSMTHEVFVERLHLVNPNIEILGRYTNANRRVKCKCTVCGRVWDAIPACLLAGDGCWDCARKAIGESQRVSVEEFVKRLKAIDPTIEIDRDSYKGTHAKVRAICTRCGNVWEPLARTLIRKNPCGCSVCRKKDRREKASAKYKEELRRTKPHISCLGDYVNRGTKILHRCDVCGYEWVTTPAVVLTSVYGCPNWKSHPAE